MLNSDAIVLSYLYGECTAIVSKVREIALQEGRDVPIFALVTKQRIDDDTVDKFDIAVSSQSHSAGKACGGVRERMLRELERTIIRVRSWKKMGWERYLNPEDSKPFLWKNVGTECERDGWRWFAETELKPVPDGQILDFLRAKERPNED